MIFRSRLSPRHGEVRRQDHTLQSYDPAAPGAVLVLSDGQTHEGIYVECESSIVGYFAECISAGVIIISVQNQVLPVSIRLDVLFIGERWISY